jgi:hypothetical protein
MLFTGLTAVIAFNEVKDFQNLLITGFLTLGSLLTIAWK